MKCTIIRNYMNARRPVGITILAVLEYGMAAWCLGLGIVCLLGKNAMMRVFHALNYLVRPEFISPETSWARLYLGILCFLSAALSYCIARGLWRLKNWARGLTLVFTVAELIFVSMPDALGPIQFVIPRDPFTLLAGRILSFVVVLYLISPQVRAAFGVIIPREKWLTPAVSVLAVLSLAFRVAKSGPELQAIRWHMHHGDRISVNEVSFPVYYWYAPRQSPDGASFAIFDSPTPLRPEDQSMVMVVEGVKDPDNTLTVEQLVDAKVLEYEKKEYKDLSKFPLQVGKQTLGCVQIASRAHETYCYGDGPICSIYFSGGDRSLDRLKRMMADARLEQPK